MKWNGCSDVGSLATELHVFWFKPLSHPVESLELPGSRLAKLLTFVVARILRRQRLSLSASIMKS